MKIKFLFLLAFFISIWTHNYIIVRWEGIPSGNTQVFCTVDGIMTPARTIELYRFTWTNDNQDGEWISREKFLEPFYTANCAGYLDNHLVAGVAVGLQTFDSFFLYLPVTQ